MIFTYLALNLFAIAYPAYACADKRLTYRQNWPGIVLAILITALFFIVWDNIFTEWGVWSFNSQYTLGIHFFNLPMEEWMFFFTVPFACMFIYEVLHYFFPGLKPSKKLVYLSYFLIVFFSIVAVLNLEKVYTSLTFFLCSVVLGIHCWYFGASLLSMFYLTYLFHLIPFLIMNGVLTAMPVVTYDNNENLGIRIGTIPMEDAFYSFIMLLMLISVYEVYKKQNSRTN